MKKLSTLLALGICAFLVFALATLPANALLSRLDTFGIRAAGVDGTVWRGRAQILQIANSNVGAVSWDLHPLALFTGRLKADVKLTRSDGFAEGVVSVSPASMEFERATATLPLSVLPATALPGGWAGTADVKIERLTLKDGWPTAAEGTLDVLNLTGPAHRPAAIGSYRVEFPAQSPAAATDTLSGALTDLGGPLQITGTVELGAQRSYLLRGLVATRPETPPEVANALQFLGPPDANGRREFSIEGTM